VFPLAVPPLRERADDIPLLVEYFIDRYARQAGKRIRRVNTRTLERLRAYPWPGNVRELQNVVERSVIVCETDEFTVDESCSRPRWSGTVGCWPARSPATSGLDRRRSAGKWRPGLRPRERSGPAVVARSTLAPDARCRDRLLRHGVGGVRTSLNTSAR
jgi:DNA-binding NtrC family response regulator